MRCMLRLPTPTNLAVLFSSLLAAATFSHHEQANADLGATHSTLISEFASFNTPGVVDGRVEAIAVDGDTVYVGGTFTQIYNPLDETNIINQPYLFAYSKSTGDIIQTFDPQLNNSVLALETTGDAAGGVFAGGIFGNLNGRFSRGRFAKIDINGDEAPGFGARVNAVVTTMVRLNNTIYIGGNFDTISGVAVERLAAIDTTTGAVSPNLNLDFGGLLTTSRIGPSMAQQGVDDVDITSDGSLLAISGNFETIDGISRPRLALIELTGQATVSNWNTNVFDIQCPARLFPNYIQGIDISPDDSYLVVGSNGFRFFADPACDAIGRYEIDDLTNTDVQPTWVNWTGGDSVYEVVATDHAIYAGGHYRWLNNDTSIDGNTAGPGAVAKAGFAALDPLNGLTLLNWESNRNPRGVGTFALIAEPEGLYMGDDTNYLNGSEHPKLKFLPLSDMVISRPTAATLPTSIATPSGNTLSGISYNGSTFGTPSTLGDSGWSDARGGVFVGGVLYHGDSQGTMWSSILSNGTFQPRMPVNLFGLTANEWDINDIGGMFFDYEQGRLYYTIRFDTQLYYRAFTPASPYFGNDRYVAETQGDIPWGEVRGMDVVDGNLYFALQDNNLYRAQINGAAVVSGTTQTISGPGIDGRQWDNDLIAFLSAEDPNAGNIAQFEFESSGSDTVRRFQRFEFPVVAGEETTLRLQWDDPNADLALYVRDANNVAVASDPSNAGSPKWLTVPAGVGGTYIASVLIREGSTPYNLRVNPVEAPPAPLADFVFSSSGTDTTGRWQVFPFDVVAGEQVTANVTWDDPTANVRIFLRDENNNPVARDIDGDLPAMVEAIAESSGTWSIAVRIVSGSVDYDVLVDTSTDFTVPPPLADFEFSSSGTPTQGQWQVFRFDVTAGETVDANVTWDDNNADVRVFLRNETNSQVARDTDGLPASLSVVAASSGQWSIAVRIVSGSVNYDVFT